MSVVGGIVVPVDRFVLLATYVGLASTIVVATVATTVYVKRVKHRKETINTFISPSLYPKHEGHISKHDYYRDELLLSFLTSENQNPQLFANSAL
ncbi:MAG: hypothetical protein QXI91_07225 [Candidatus Bathyarchaeia archaeon]